MMNSHDTLLPVYVGGLGKEAFTASVIDAEFVTMETGRVTTVDKRLVLPDRSTIRNILLHHGGRLQPQINPLYLRGRMVGHPSVKDGAWATSALVTDIVVLQVLASLEDGCVAVTYMVRTADGIPYLITISLNNH